MPLPVVGPPAHRVAPPRRGGRKQPRTHEDNRLRSRTIEFASVGFIGSALAVGAYSMVQHAFARSLGAVRVALGG